MTLDPDRTPGGKVSPPNPGQAPEAPACSPATARGSGADNAPSPALLNAIQRDLGATIARELYAAVTIAVANTFERLAIRTTVDYLRDHDAMTDEMLWAATVVMLERVGDDLEPVEAK
jgi:hypothetical protein